MKVDVVTLDKKSIGAIDLPEKIFGLEVRSDVLQRVVRWQLARRQAGTHQTKTVSDVSGTTRKPFKQKGTGRARQGSARAAQFRGGGVSFGPVSRSHAHALTKKFRCLGLKTALSSKAKDGKLKIVDFGEFSGKTRDLSSAVKDFGFESVLMVGGNSLNSCLQRAAANIPEVSLLPSRGVNVYDILRRDVLVLTREALSDLEERLG